MINTSETNFALAGMVLLPLWLLFHLYVQVVLHFFPEHNCRAKGGRRETQKRAPEWRRRNSLPTRLLLVLRLLMLLLLLLTPPLLWKCIYWRQARTRILLSPKMSEPDGILRGFIFVHIAMGGLSCIGQKAIVLCLMNTFSCVFELKMCL